MVVVVYNSDSPSKKQQCIDPFYAWMLVNRRGQPFQGTPEQKAYKRWVERPCSKQRCPCVLCRHTWARNEAAILAKSFETLPPTHFAVLRHDSLAPKNVWSCFTRFTRLVRDTIRNKVEFEYAAYIEQSPNKPPHVHMLVRTHASIDKVVMRPLWVKACDDELICILGNKTTERPQPTLYFEQIRSPKNAAKYVPKFWFYHHPSKKRLIPYQPWHPTIEWASVKLQTTSRRFLSMDRDALWEAVKRDWFPDGEINYDDYEVWQPHGVGFEITNQVKLREWLEHLTVV